jgi:hypothetical protein
MLKVLVALAALVSASPSWACGVFTLENRPPGERVAKIEDDRVLTIEEAGESEVYDLVSAGSGLPYMIGERQGGGDGVEVLEHKGDLIIGSMVYVPYCEGR